MTQILSNKIKLEEFETIALNDECSVVLQRKLPSNVLNEECGSRRTDHES